MGQSLVRTWGIETPSGFQFSDVKKAPSQPTSSSSPFCHPQTSGMMVTVLFCIPSSWMYSSN
jgi:hypothetical protein